MMKRLLLISAVTLLPMTALVAAPVHAGQSGVYVGGSIGNADVGYDGEHSDFNDIDIDIDFDDDDLGYKIFAGFNLNVIELVDLGIEAAYVDFGEQEGSIADITGNKLEVDAWTVAALAGFDIGPIGVFAKAGFASWDGDITAGDDDLSEDGTDPLYGVGAKFQVGPFAVRGEYEVYDLDDIEIDYVSAGVSYTF